MPVDVKRQLRKSGGCDATDVPSHGAWIVKALPTHELGPPRHIRILSVCKKVLVEKLTLYRDVVNHAPAVQDGGACGPEHKGRHIVLSAIHFFCAAVKMAQVSEKVDPRRVDHPAKGNAFAPLPAKKFATCHAH